MVMESLGFYLVTQKGTFEKRREKRVKERAIHEEFVKFMTNLDSSWRFDPSVP